MTNAKAGRHRDDKGLYLLVSSTGAKSWVLRAVVNDGRRDFGLGSADLVTLAEARDKALYGRRKAKAGVDPSIEWKKAMAVVPTSGQAARAYHGIVKDGWKNGKHGDQWLTTLEVHVFPRIGSRRVDLIDVPAIQSVLLPIRLTIPETARRVRQRINAVLDYAHGQGWRAGETPRNAVNSLLKSIKQAKGGNFAAMSYAELPGFLGKLRMGESSVGRLAPRFTILAAARSGEARGAVWDKVDLDGGVWSMPAERMKAGEAHGVPLIRARVLTGTINYAAHLTIPTAIALHRRIGPTRKLAHLTSLSNDWMNRIRDVPGLRIMVPDEPGRYAAISAFRPANVRSWEDAQRFQARMIRHRVLVVAKRGLASGPVMRVTPALFNTRAELDALVRAIRIEAVA